MAENITAFDKLTNLADAIRNKTGVTGALTLDQMTEEIQNFQGGGIELNYKVVSKQPDVPTENTVWVETEDTITKYAFSVENPWVNQIETELAGNLTQVAGYFSDAGVITAQNSTNKEVYGEEYIPVQYGKIYNWTYTLSEPKSQWLSLVAYDESQTIVGTRLELVNSVTGTSQTGTYTPTAGNIKYVRLTWRTFGLENSVSFSGPVDVTDPEEANGAVWFRTSYYSYADFNLLDNNQLWVYPVQAKQYVNGRWVEKTCKTFNGQEWIDWVPYGALYWYGNMCTPVSGGTWSAANLRPNSDWGSEYDLPTFTNTEDCFIINWSIAGWGSGGAFLDTFQDLTDVTGIEIDCEVEVLQNPADLSMSVYQSKSVNYDSSNVASVRLAKSNGGPYTVTRQKFLLDTSALGGSYGIQFMGYDSWTGSNSTIILKIYSIIKIFAE